MCETCKSNSQDKDEKIEEFVKEFQEHGIGCGIEISKLAKEIHPSAVTIIPLYRSCIVIEQSNEEKKEGTAAIHAYADPHWLGRDITIDALQSDDFHAKFMIHGQREGPEICLVNANNYEKMMREQNKEIKE